jgi:hypothetical protein
MVESGQLVAHEMAVDLAADGVEAGCAEHFQQNPVNVR